jgi:alkylhydroperoxidase family enzyme
MSRTMKTAALLVLGVGLLPAIVKADPPSKGAGGAAVLGYEPLSNDESWKRLPVEARTGEPLPSWARVLAGPTPHLAAALLHLDFVHRAKSPLDPKLRAEMRWVAAHANHCAYSEACALADARRAGCDDATIEALQRGDYSKVPAAEKAALEFARKMTVNSYSVTDDEFAALVKAYSEMNAAAMVMLMAYANFQDRFLLCLGAPLETDGSLPPVDVVAIREPRGDQQNQQRPTGQTSPLPKPTGKDLIEDDLEWTGVTYDELQERLERQKNKTTRVRVPTWDEVKAVMPPSNSPNANRRPTRVIWNLVCSGYQPELASAWSTSGRTIGIDFKDHPLDRVFSTSLFWVVTRAINCPYCMGHTEMILETHGLSKSEVAERARLLAGEDWSSFPAEEQRAFAFARKLTRAPWTISSADIESLKRDFGPERALAIMRSASHNNYMTRISNGFQLSLERDNVFMDRFLQDSEPVKSASPSAAK